MKKYLVGGAVRDKLQGIPIKERDWVVVGATPKDMHDLGFIQVGKEFPVFLHPDTKEEYALARKEKKAGSGYTGFICDFDKRVTLEEDLVRRDLTINAIAEDDVGNVTDPNGGQRDIKDKILRHISPAFIEDPVRILRVARFAARLTGFQVAPETINLIQGMVEVGEIDHLTAERVWREWQRALTEPSPHRFLEVLHQCNALAHLFPIFDEHYQTALQYLTKGAQLSADVQDRFVVLMLATKNEKAIITLTRRYKIPNDYKEQAILCFRYLHDFQHADQLSSQQLLDVLYQLDAFRREVRFIKWLAQSQLCTAVISNGVLSDFIAPYQRLSDAYHQVKGMQLNPLELEGKQGREIADCLYQKRLLALR